MSIDQNADAATTGAATDEISSTADTGAEQASQENSAQNSEGASETSAPADKAAQQQDGDGSSATPDTTSQAAATTAAQPDWAAEKAALEKRINDLRSGYSKEKLRADQITKRFDGIDPDKYRQFVDRGQKAELPAWDTRSEKNRQFQGTLAAWERHKALIQGAQSPEEAKVLRDALGRAFTDDESRQIMAWEQHQRAEVARMASDPNAYREKMREEAVAAVREELQAAEEVRRVSSWFENKANEPIVEKYREFMVEKINQGYPWHVIQELVEAKAAADSLQSRVGGAEKASATARAQTSALKSSAAVTRDPATKVIPAKDYWKEAVKWAEKQGYPTDHPRVARYLDDLVKQSRT